MSIQNIYYYQALVSHDSRFDGHFFVGVSSTGIYCRPVCRVRTPKIENCSFYTSAALAEAAGFRPCLKCRPELSPQIAQHVNDQNLILSAITQLEDLGHTDFSIAELSRHLHISTRHLSRMALAQFGTTPSNIILTRRLLRAKQLLTETHLPIIHVAYISGFSSLRTFNMHFKNRYQSAPSSLRKRADITEANTTRIDTTRINTKSRASTTSPAKPIKLMLQYRPPYNWQQLIEFLEQRTVRGVEYVEEQTYSRTVNLTVNEKNYQGWLQVQLHLTKANTLAIELSESLSDIIPIVLRKLEHQFDLHAEPALIAKQLGKLVNNNQGIRLPGSFDGFEMAVRAILGQQITVKAAHTLAGRFAEAFGTRIHTTHRALTTLFPSAEVASTLSIDQIASLGIISKRAHTIIILAEKISKSEIVLQPSASPDITINTLTQIPGIGPWTAHYIAMRALHWPDAFPHTDLGIMKALQERRPKKLLALAEKWRPWRAYAVMHLWHSLREPWNNSPINITNQPLENTVTSISTQCKEQS
ncbi:Ada metal-binding domain-containing protein [Neptunomonas antarctica]|uniref:DNA-3-methyladenine glycosylase II n=1 Tax=Neptunomonas antarctica TaxID=619304 RepID=A0A1N7J2H2_9GAMM|nr:Ada metal-binding domain-containing protein [Neptunomonas antarctica]SIS43540.1 DNA-3-methyladenine glycosylase II [Neptunomonas antarctica]